MNDNTLICPSCWKVFHRLCILLNSVRRIRANLYPEGWDADPLYQIEQELEALLQELA